jgi:hypothetical protein
VENRDGIIGLFEPGEEGEQGVSLSF